MFCHNFLITNGSPGWSSWLGTCSPESGAVRASSQSRAAFVDATTCLQDKRDEVVYHGTMVRTYTCTYHGTRHVVLELVLSGRTHVRTTYVRTYTYVPWYAIPWYSRVRTMDATNGTNWYSIHVYVQHYLKKYHGTYQWYTCTYTCTVLASYLGSVRQYSS